MSKTTNRDTAPRSETSTEDRLARLLDAPYLARVVPHLPPETLHQIVRHRGLDACGELLTSATPAQLTSLLDLDLWRHARPGRDERFDVDRFGEWLEVLVDTGTSVAARTIAALDANIVVAGLSRYVRVLDPGIFEPTAQSDDEAIDRHEAMREGDSIRIGDEPLHEPIDESLECETGGYIVRARRTDAWDAIVTLLAALDTEHGACFQAVMQGCRRLSNSRPEIDGLDDLLQASEQHLHEVTIDRERRRSQQGYATPADARAFLQMAREPKGMRAAASGRREVNPIVAAYFRAADEQPEPLNDAAHSPERAPESLPPSAPPSSEVHSQGAGASESLEAALELLAEAGMMPPRPRALLEAADSDPQAARLAHLRRLMTYVRDTGDAACVARGRELAFLANTLVAGCSVQGRTFTPQEASDAAASICNLGLEYRAGMPSGDTSLPDSLPVDHDLVTAFEVGWSVLHHDVSLFVADGLISMLDDMDCGDREIRYGLTALRRSLVRERGAGTPWRARDAAEILATLDATAWISVLGLLDECPVLPAALTAVLEARTTPVSATAFQFISTAAQIGDVRIFMRKLPGLLTGR
jgi:hypothetical protein